MNDSDFRPNEADNDTYTSSDFTTEHTNFTGAFRAPAPDVRVETRRTFSRLGLAISLLVVGMFVAQYAFMFLMLWLDPNIGEKWWANWVLSVVPLYGVGLPILLLALKKIPVAPHNAQIDSGYGLYDKPAFRLKNWLMLLVMGFGCMYIGSIIGNVLMETLSALVGYSYANGLEEMVDTAPLWATAFVTCIVAPLGEEFIFRKLFIDRARRFGDTTAILLSGILFGLFHGNLFQFFYAAMLGIILAYIYTRTGNFWWCAGMHAVANLMGGVVIPQLSQFLPEDPEAVLTMPQMLVSILLSVWIYGVIIGAIVILIKRLRWRALSPAPNRRAAGEVLRDAMANPGMIFLMILLVAMIVLALIPPAPAA